MSSDIQGISVQLNPNHAQKINVRQAKVPNSSLLFHWLRYPIEIFTHRENLLKTSALDY
jgi:hypothetical protein